VDSHLSQWLGRLHTWMPQPSVSPLRTPWFEWSLASEKQESKQSLGNATYDYEWGIFWNIAYYMAPGSVYKQISWRTQHIKLGILSNKNRFDIATGCNWSYYQYSWWRREELSRKILVLDVLDVTSMSNSPRFRPATKNSYAQTLMDPHMERSDMNPRDMRGLISLEPCSQDV